MNKKVRSENVAQQIKHWKNPLASKVESRRLFKNSLANDFIRLRRLARQCHKIRDHDGLDEIGLYLGQSLSSYETYFSDHEFAQLIGANFKQVEKLRWEYDGDGYETPFFVILLLQGLEQDQEQPLAKAIVQTLKREFAEAPALGERARDALEDMMPEIRGKYYTLVEDKEGKQTLGKIYPPLKLVKKVSKAARVKCYEVEELGGGGFNGEEPGIY